ncbi:SPRY domain-containing protein [Pilobolus umbonatus]|nr:SPRY domain-containing protein [Pilobolus umbonatus]
MTMTFSFANKVRETCFKSLLDLCTSSRQEKVQLTCAKGALMVVIKNRYLITQLNQKVTETLIDTVNTLSQQVLNIVMSQILMYKLKSDRWNITSSSDQPEKDASKIYEKEDVEVEKFTMNELPPHSNHLSINDEEGEMEHISALESISRELQLLSEHTEMNSPQQMMDGPTPLIESSTLNQNTSQGSLEIDIPVAVRDQLLGCLTALRIFLENDEFISNLISMNNYRMPTMEDLVNSNGTSDVAKSSIYHHMNYVTSHIESDFYPCDDLPPSLLTPVIPFLSLTKPLKLLITHLVYIILGSTMSAFASNNANNYSVETLDKLQYINVYQDVMKWISSQTHLPPDQLYEDIYETSDDEYSDSSSIDEDAAGTISYHINKSSFSISALSCLPSDSNKDTQAESSENQKPTSSKGISVHYEYQKGEGDMLEEIEENQEPTALNSLKSNPEFSCKALILLNALIAYAPAKKYMIEELNVISVLVYILEHHEDLLENATMCLAGLVGDDMNTEIPEESFKKMVILLWLEMRASLPPSTCFMFYSQLTLGWCSRMVSNKNRKFLTTDHRSSQRATLISNHPAFAEIDLVTRSKYCQINYETRLQVRNDSWTFETVRCTHCVPPLSEDNQNDPQKYAFEIVLESYGLMQVGWVTEDFVFDPEGGKGVGDDSESYGYDGKRAKKWHGKNSTVRASYGMIWEIDDTITCAIDMREGEIRYYKNGNDMGIAFSKVSRTRAWYPAISLATGQQCSFLFGSSIDSLRHLPDGYTPIGMITHKSCTNIELPPPPPMDNPIDLYTSILSDENDTSMRSTVDNEISSSNEAYQNRDSTEPNLKPVEPDANDRYLTSIDSREHLFTVQKASIQDQYTLPSMYYEVTIGFIHKENEGFDLSASESLIILGLQSLIPQTSLYFEFDRANKVCRFVLGSERSESFSLDIKDGSTVELVQLHKHTKTKPYLPFVNGCMRSRINFGEVPYIWKLADSLPSKLHMSNYLNRLIGTKKSSQAK